MVSGIEIRAPSLERARKLELGTDWNLSKENWNSPGAVRRQVVCMEKHLFASGNIRQDTDGVVTTA